MTELLSQLSQAEQTVGKENLDDNTVPFEVYRLGQSNVTFIPNNLNQQNKNETTVNFDKFYTKLQKFNLKIDETQSAENFSNSKIHSTSNLPLDLGPFNYEDNIKTIENKYLKVDNNFSQKELNEYQLLIEESPDFNNLMKFQISDIKLKLQSNYSKVFGRFDSKDYEESIISSDNLTAQNSLSIKRAPYKSKNYEYVTGKSENVPFMPGGFTINDLLKDSNIMNSETNELEINQNELLKIAPGFDRGLTIEDNKNIENITSFDIENILEDNDDLESMDELKKLVDNINNKENNDNDQYAESDNLENEEENEDSKEDYNENIEEIDNLINKPNDENYNLKLMNLNEQHKKWAHKVDITDSFPEFYDLIPEMAHDFPFELDVFQKQAIFHLENGDSVFIAAHTSAGKTVVADYAIALAQKHMTRAIYTSPIKALSNQKFRDFHNTFEDIGIITGDVKINQNASCLIMTTEILRSMLYKGADIIRDVEFVIFDEVHYINDSERGVVWEEVIIMLPEHVKLILLSATVPNTMEFAEWIGRTKKKNIYVISTLKRPVPLEHYLFVKNNIYKIVDAQKNFLRNNYDAANEALTGISQDKNSKTSNNNKKTNNKNAKPIVKSKKPVSKMQTTRNMYNHMVGFLAKSELLPVVIFTFSKKKCEEYADGLINKDLLNDASKRSAIYSFISNSLSRLKGSDRELPQIHRMKELLSRGIGVHHSGLLPIMKEVVEILFSKGLVKVLFATETFAMGVNMPARAVVFSELRKHDGQKFRDLLSNEYIQMSGRAGRRGLDDTGVVIIATLDKLPEIQTINNVVLGKSQKLESQFRLTYNMILNLLRVETLRVEEMIKRSFSENVTQAALPEQQQEYEKNNELLKNMEDLSCVICKIDINLYYNYTEEILNLNKEIHKKIITSSNNQRIFCPGRILIINNEKFHRTIAVILKISTKLHNNIIMSSEEDKKLIHCLIVHESINLDDQIKEIYNPIVNGKLNICEVNNIKSSVQTITYVDIELITSTIIKIEQDSILNHNESVISSVQQELIRIAKSFNDSDTIEECSWKKLRDIEFQEYHKKRTLLLEKVKSLKCNNCPDFKDHFNIISEKKKIEFKINELFKNLSENNLQLLPDYNQRIEVLKFLRYIDDNLTVQLKGKIACEISTCDELLLTELVLDNFFAEFDLAESAALLSCFIFQEKSQNEPALTSNLEKGIAKIKDMALNLADIQRSFNIDISTQDYVSTVNIGLVEVVYEWAKGVPFKQITELTDVLEGSIVRCIVRLDEVCRQVKNASRIIGDSSLYIKMEKTSELIKRDIVFAQSLYF